MHRAIAGAALIAVVFAAGCAASPPVTPKASPTPSASVSVPATSAEQPSEVATIPPLKPALPAAGDWAPEITNPWLPFNPGTTFTYKGMKDGQPTVDTYVVTTRKKMISGVSATVVLNTLKTGTHEIEGTEDWYAQDKQGNVWYLGEATRTFDKNGKVKSTIGSWQAGVNGAQAGLFMPAAPKVGDSYYQEFLAGHAEDQYQVISLDGTITVPYGTYTNAVVTREVTALEPTIVSQKYYVKGIGQVFENDVKGSQEYAKLVSITKK
jgi:hypothetical protein